MSTSYRQHDYRYRKTYGITLNEVEQLWRNQGCKCASCRDPIERPPSKGTHLDHNAKTGAIRGVLCSRCNIALGHLKDCPDRIEALKRYLIYSSRPVLLVSVEEIG